MSKSPGRQGGDDLAGDVKGRTQVVAEETYDADLEQKERILDECLDDDIWTMQADTWIRICGICRVREGIWRGHDWRDCTMYTEGRELVRETHREIAKMFPALGRMRYQLCLAPEGVCPGCGEMMRKCWTSVTSVGGELQHRTAGCKFSGVIMESVAVILAMGPWFVAKWEERWSHGGFYEERFGCLAVARVWRTFGWLGAMEIRQMGAEELVPRCRERLQGLTGKDRVGWRGTKGRVFPAIDSVRQTGSVGVQGPVVLLTQTAEAAHKDMCLS